MHVQVSRLEIHLIPTQRDELRRAKAMPEGEQNHGAIPMAMSSNASRCLHYGFDFVGSQELAAANTRVGLTPGRHYFPV